MPSFKLILVIFSGFSFLFYGFMCFYSNYFRSEFIRYGLAKYRRTTGFFQILGGMSLILGIFIYELEIISSLGLTILMLMGVGVRLKIKDGLFRTLPAIFYVIVNALIFYLSINN